MTASRLTTSVWGPGDPGAAAARRQRQQDARHRIQAREAAERQAAEKGEQQQKSR
jgi:hypothetical protein